MQAILTRYMGPTNCRGSRIKATCDRGSITVSYPDHLSGDACHRYAAQSLVEKFISEDAAKYGSGKNPWALPFVTGGLPGNAGYVHIFLSPSEVERADADATR